MTDKPASATSKKRGPSQGEARKAAEAAGISRSQMWRWMKLAEIPDAEFEALIESGTKLSSARLIEIARRRKGLAPSGGQAPRRHACPHCGGDLLSTEDTRP